MDLKKLILNEKQYMINLRREFHMYPEVSWEEFRTSQRVKEELNKMGINYIPVAKTGILATINGKNEGRKLILRADLDALSVKELNEFEHKSVTDGVMHACGHDGHVAMLLGAAKILHNIRDTFDGEIKLLFQPAEEVCQGMRVVLEENVLGEADGCFGIHIWSDLPCGKISVEEGPRMASGDWGILKVKGKGCHGSMPHQGVDAIVVASAIVMNLQSIVSRELNHLDTNVVSVGMIEGGERFNVIAPEAKITFTVRSFNKNTRMEIPKIIERIAKKTAEAYRAEAELDYYFYGAAAVVNDSEASKIAENSVLKLYGSEYLSKFEKITASEDFGILQENYPGVFVFVGGGNPEKGCDVAHHNGKFDIDEDSLELGCGLTVQYSLDFLNQ